ncbi:MAG: SDR family oxidoreductase, partial [Candidatus Binatia bacterium]
MSSTILVTGATGTVGSEVAKQLSAKGADVRACCHTLSKADRIRGPGVEIVEVDYAKPETVEAAFPGVERLFLLTPGWPGVERTVEITAQLVEEAKKAGVQHIVKLSVLWADTESKIPPFRWHRQAEKIVEESGIPYTFVRPSGFMQTYPISHGQTIKAQSAIYTSAGEGKVGFVDARDIAAVAVEALTGDGHEGKIYPTTGPEALSHNQVAEILSEVLGRKISHVSVSEEDVRKGFEETGLPDWFLDAAIEGDRNIREGRSSAVSPTVEEVTGKKPRSFEQFARD